MVNGIRRFSFTLSTTSGDNGLLEALCFCDDFIGSNREQSDREISRFIGLGLPRALSPSVPQPNLSVWNYRCPIPSWTTPKTPAVTSCAWREANSIKSRKARP